MTDYGLAGELPAGDRARPEADSGAADRRPIAPAISVAEILALCDRRLHEVGRRNHVFGWLRRPGGGADAWLPVDAYYPRNRLVVTCRSGTEQAHDRVYREVVPAHGLRLLELTPADLGRTRAGAERAVAALLADLAPPPPTAAARTAAAAPDTAPSPAATSRPSGAATQRASRAASPRASRAATPAPDPAPSLPAAERAARFLAARAGRPPAPARRESPMLGIVVAAGLVVLAVVVAIYVLSITGG